ncbi:hypothetical protein [Halosimplex pelagicum]|uniref:Uncharacterized protein n=1 Tax=Halosimplex pelagicum TaxID=869886 RepID=A0A7D5P9H9_9EURY|nr:hypothetical protein [Halosimplex pelagicum]QLH84106.1 hypothetical protein HZS54_21785 [Halosimplex pelagicum]
MAKQPELVRSADGDLRVDASFPSGRYTFSLRSEAGDLLTELGHTSGDAVPWHLFEALVVVGDVWLPNTADGIVDDLAAPDSITRMDDEEAATAAEYLRKRRIGAEGRERLADVVASSALRDHLSVDELRSNEAFVAETESLVSEAEDGTAAGSEDAQEASPDRGTASAAAVDPASDASLLHVGKATLGRANMGRSVREADYLDAFSQAVDIAVERGVDAVVQTGRLFQSGSPDRETVSGLQTQLARLQDEEIPFYLACGPKELEVRSTVVRSLATSGLLTPIGGEAVAVDDGVTLVGVDADAEPAAVAAELDDPPADGTLLVACGGLDVDDARTSAVEELVDELPRRPAAVLAGERTDPGGAERAGVRLFDPGSTEHVLSKSTIGDDPPARGVDEHSFADGTREVTRHELDARPFATFEFEVTPSTTLDSIEERIADRDLTERAVLAVLEGSEPGAGEPSREAVQSLLADRAFCARVYDERSVPEDAEEEEEEERPDEAEKIDPDRVETLVRGLAETIAELEAADSADVSGMEMATLADSYAVLSKAKSEIEDLRTAARDELTSRVEPDETVVGSVGAVAGAKRRRRSLRDDETVESALREHGVPVERVTTESIDSEKVEEVVADEDGAISESAVFEVTETEYVRRRDLDLDGGVELGATDDDNEASADEDGEPADEAGGGPHKVYLGEGASIGGWTPVERSVVEREIVPLVKANSSGDDEETISVNFGSGVSTSGWNRVDADVVREQITPLVERHRVPE